MQLCIQGALLIVVTESGGYPLKITVNPITPIRPEPTNYTAAYRHRAGISRMNNPEMELRLKMLVATRLALFSGETPSRTFCQVATALPEN